MDAAKGKDGPGMARFADPWSGDGMRAPGAKRRAEVGARLFGYFWGDCQKYLARKARNQTSSTCGNEDRLPTQKYATTCRATIDHSGPPPLKRYALTQVSTPIRTACGQPPAA